MNLKVAILKVKLVFTGYLLKMTTNFQRIDFIIRHII